MATPTKPRVSPEVQEIIRRTREMIQRERLSERWIITEAGRKALKQPDPQPQTRYMSQELRTARAIARANAQRGHVRALQGRPGYYQVRSATDPQERYVLAVHDGIVECSCPAGEHGKYCWHRARLEARLIREAHRHQKQAA